MTARGAAVATAVAVAALAACSDGGAQGSSLTVDKGGSTECLRVAAGDGLSQEVVFGLDDLRLHGHEVVLTGVDLGDVQPAGSLVVGHQVVVSLVDSAGTPETGVGVAARWTEGWIDPVRRAAAVPIGQPLADGPPLHSTQWQLVLGVRLRGERGEAGPVTLRYRSDTGVQKQVTGYQRFGLLRGSARC